MQSWRPHLVILGVIGLVVALLAGQHVATSGAIGSGRAQVESTPVAGPAPAAIEVGPSGSAVAVPDDPWWSKQWGHDVLSARAAWRITQGSPEVVIAVVDSGINPNPDLDGRIVPGRNMVDDSDDTSDDHGHGTLVAGVAAAEADNGWGVAGWCPACRVMPIKVLDGEGRASYRHIAAGVRWAVDHGARIVNLSVVGEKESDDLADAVTYARARGAVVVAAAGNEGCACPRFPAAIPGVVAVGGTERDDTLTGASNRGAEWVDVAAPGHNVTTGADGEVWSFTGTSSAAPVVAGIAGLALAANPNLTGLQLETALLQGTVDIGGDVATGRIEPRAVLAAAVRAAGAGGS